METNGLRQEMDSSGPAASKICELDGGQDDKRRRLGMSSAEAGDGEEAGNGLTKAGTRSDGGEGRSPAGGRRFLRRSELEVAASRLCPFGNEPVRREIPSLRVRGLPWNWNEFP